MSDFLDTQIVKVVGQIVNGEQQVYVGVKTDNNVRTLLFTGLPFLGDAQVVSIYWTLEDGSLDDSTRLEKSVDGYVWTINNNLTQHGGKTVKGYLTVTSGLQTWNTKKFPIVIADLPKAADGSSSFTPTLYGQILETANTIEVLKLATDDNAEATAGDRLAVEDALEHTNQNAQSTAEDRLAAEQAAQKTDADVRATALDRAAVDQARIDVETDMLAADEDAQATAADRLAIAEVLTEATALRNATKMDKEAADADALATSRDRQAVADDKVSTHTAMQTAVEKALVAYQSMVDAGLSRDQAAQALSDLIAMLGSQVATLGADGKLTPGQIPALSINDVFPVANTSEMLGLTAQRGDTAVITTAGIVSDCYLLMTDDPTVLENWAKLGISYVANAGHAMTADSATDSQKINGKRIVGMTDSQYALAETAGTLDPDTLYITVPD